MGGSEQQYQHCQKQLQQLLSKITTMFSTRCLGDRFIMDRPPTYLSAHSDTQGPDTYDKYLYREMLASNPDTSLEDHLLTKVARQNEQHSISSSLPRVLNPQAEKVLDAPDIKDDYYLNLLDWSSKGVLAIGLSERVYLYSPKQITELCTQTQGNYICSLNFHPQGSLLSVGLFSGKTQVYDVETETVVRTVKGHSHRVSSSAFTYGLLYTGSRDTSILGHDIRAHHSISMRLQGHRGEVCGLKHDACGLASGSNDDMAMVWDLNMGKSRYQLHGHKGAVKALSWCPWQRNLLITGGGTSDKTMRMWNIETGKSVNVINTESQVCSIVCHPEEREILSSHGYSENQLSLWRVDKSDINYLSCFKQAELFGHTQRVLHMSLSPDSSTVCTASADETLRFWKVFQNNGSRFEGKNSRAKADLETCSLR